MTTTVLEPNLTDPLQFEITCPAEVQVLSMVRRFIVGVAEEAGFDEDDLLKIEMALDEACSNALIHGSPKKPAGERVDVDIRILLEPHMLTIQIRDQGTDRPADEFKGAGTILEYAAPDRPNYGGLGILVMKQFMDEVEFLTIPETGTMVTLRKIRKGAEEPMESPQT
jgi:serine/threonine-protein kinase RsbW